MLRVLELRNNLVLNQPLTSEMQVMKEELCFDNPQYLSAMKYSKWGKTNLPRYINYYDYDPKSKTFSVPLGYLSDLLERLEKPVMIKDLRINKELKNVPEFKLTLRGDQQEAFNAFFDKLSIRNFSGIAQLPTGKGKSILALSIAHKLKARTLIVVHKEDLVTGWWKDIDLSFDNKVDTGLIKARSRSVGDFITIATVQTLNKLDSDTLNELYNTFTLVIQDEMHHCPSTSFSLVSNFNARYKIGLTATPERSDGLSHVMKLYFGDFFYKYKKTYGETEKDILPVGVRVRPVTQVYIDPLFKEHKQGQRTIYEIVDLLAQKGEEPKDNNKYVRYSEIPYNKRPKILYNTFDDMVVRDSDFKKAVCKDIIDCFKKGKNCVLFFTQKEHVRIYKDYLEEALGRDTVQCFYGDNKDNLSVLQRAESGECRITLTTYSKGTEGTNVKSWDTEFLVSSINNGKNVEQAVGRVRRIKEGKPDMAEVYDYRTPNVCTFKQHAHTRDTRYRKLGAKFLTGDNQQSRGTLFKLGF